LLSFSAMANPVPTPKSITEKIEILWCALFNKDKFKKLEDEDWERCKNLVDPYTRLEKIRTAYFQSFLIMLISMVSGMSVGFAIGEYTNITETCITLLLAGGAGILLWTTLAVRGWDIQSIDGVTLSEQFNRCLYRFLYIVGTFLVMIAAGFEIAKQP